VSERHVGQRHQLIDIVRERGVHDPDVLHAVDAVPRHLFLPDAVRHRAYEDAPVPIGFNQTASQPSLQAFSIQLLEVGPSDTVLEVGTGSGYQTALLAQVSERVFSIERVRELSIRARAALDALRISNVVLMVGDGSIGWRRYAPFDVIIVSAGAPEVPRALIEQLADGGRMLVPIGTLETQQLVLVRRRGDEIEQETVSACTFVPLLGRFAWPEEGTS